MSGGLVLYNSPLKTAAPNFKKFERKIKKLLTDTSNCDIIKKLLLRTGNNMNLENERLNSV